MTPAEQDQMDRELRDMRKRLDRLEALIERIERRDVNTAPLPRPDYETKGMIADPLGR